MFKIAFSFKAEAKSRLGIASLAPIVLTFIWVAIQLLAMLFKLIAATTV